MKYLSVLLFLLFPILAFSQDLTGIWRGHFKSNYSRVVEKLYGIEDRYKFELQLDQHSQKFTGVTYSYKTTVFYGKASCRGAVNLGTHKVMLEEIKIVEVRMSDGGDACIMTLFMNYSKNGDDEFMEGTYTSMNTRDSSSCGRGTVFLRKVPTSDFYKEPFLVKREKESLKKYNPPPVKAPAAIGAATPKTSRPEAKNQTLAKNQPQKKSSTPPVSKKISPAQHDIVRTRPAGSIMAPARSDSSRDIEIGQIEKKINPNLPTPKVLATRENELVKTIVVNTKEVVIDIYDSGEIDNDTVSVFLDKKLVVSKQRLTDKAITFRFNLDESSDYHEVVMVAENLGDIPPNTSLMIVKAGDKQYEVRIASTEQKNAVVIFKYEKPG